MRKIKKSDELQLLKRGNIFKHGMFCLIGLLLLNTLLYSQGIEWASGKWAELTIILFTIVLCSIEFILYDIYPLTENKQKHLIYFLGLFGFVALIACIYDLIVGKSGIVVDGKITETALGIIYGLMFISVFVVYKLKKQYNAKHENDE